MESLRMLGNCEEASKILLPVYIYSLHSERAEVEQQEQE
jgi:hypothetical protein